MVPCILIVLRLGVLVVELLFRVKSEFCAFCNAIIDDNTLNSVDCCEKHASH